MAPAAFRMQFAAAFAATALTVVLSVRTDIATRLGEQPVDAPPPGAEAKLDVESAKNHAKKIIKKALFGQTETASVPVPWPEPTARPPAEQDPRPSSARKSVPEGAEAALDVESAKNHAKEIIKEALPGQTETAFDPVPWPEPTARPPAGQDPRPSSARKSVPEGAEAALDFKSVKKHAKTMIKEALFGRVETASDSEQKPQPSSARKEVPEGWEMPEDWVSYTPGNIPIIISAPHNGQIKPKDVPLRQHGCWVGSDDKGECLWEYDCAEPDAKRCHAETLADMNSLRIAQMMFDLLSKATGGTPYFVVNNLHRSYLDANRKKPEAADGIPEMEVAYDTFFGRAREAHDAVQAACGRGLWIDVHGHAQNQYVMLGYDFPEESFKFKNSTLDAKLKYAKDSTIRALSKDHPSGYTFSRLLRGDVSFGTLLWNEGAETVPSERMRNPAVLNGQYLDGAVIVNRFGSQSRGTVDGIQMEVPSQWRNGYDNVKPKAANTQFAKKAVTALLAFMEKAYGWSAEGLATACTS